MSEEKTIAVYCCENSGLLAAESTADPAVLSGLEILRIPCSGKMEIGLALKTLERGYAGVLVLGCPLDNCKFIRGNERAEKRVEKTKALLRSAGLAENRIHMDFLSSVDTNKFVRIVMNMKGELGMSGAPASALSEE